MFWKMSIDLSRPLVSSMGLHDPLDGLITCAELSTTAARIHATKQGPDLERESAMLAAMTASVELSTSDPLGIGGLLVDASRIARLGDHFRGQLPDVADLLGCAERGLQCYLATKPMQRPAAERLAFRELGLAKGLHAIELMPDGAPPLLDRYAQLATDLDAFWLDPKHRASDKWSEHRDINEVMLAASLLPEATLGPRSDG
jgi:hypothetical protein